MDQATSRKIYEKALFYGYDNCGIIPIGELAGYNARLDERLAKFPHSAAVYQFADAFKNIRDIYPWAKSVVVCTEWYGKYRFPKSLRGKYAKAFLLSPSTVPDSEEHSKKFQFEEWMKEEGIRFVGGETGVPARIMPLRHAAEAAGLGIIRRNNFLYTDKGSWVALEGYLIDKDCEYRHECKLRPCSDKCGLCQRACKTRALADAYTMDPLSCVSFWTTFGQGNVPPHLSAEMYGAWLLGCDACQDACPHNRHNWDDGADFLGLDSLEELLNPLNILNASDAELMEKVIPKSEFHLKTEEVAVLRKSAARVVQYEEAAKIDA